eukprot:1018262-Lingulodinium_polyedra.AAC.1
MDGSLPQGAQRPWPVQGPMGPTRHSRRGPGSRSTMPPEARRPKLGWTLLPLKCNTRARQAYQWWRLCSPQGTSPRNGRGHSCLSPFARQLRKAHRRMSKPPKWPSGCSQPSQDPPWCLHGARPPGRQAEPTTCCTPWLARSVGRPCRPNCPAHSRVAADRTWELALGLSTAVATHRPPEQTSCLPPVE